MEASAREVFVGRVRELGQLERALDATRAGGGTTALVTGDAGIGKTRLASELAARARGAGFEALLGRSIELVGTELPFQPFVEALRPLGALPRTDAQAAGSQLRVFQETLALLHDRAAAAPLLLVLEDLHWADISTLDLVVFLATTSATSGCCCWRPSAPTSPPRPRACAGWPTASDARARRCC
jgi:predicted ATPase